MNSWSWNLLPFRKGTAVRFFPALWWWTCLQFETALACTFLEICLSSVAFIWMWCRMGLLSVGNPQALCSPCPPWNSPVTPQKVPSLLGAKCAYVGEIPVSAVHLIRGCQVPHLFQYINNASPWGWLLSLEFAVYKCFSVLMNSVIKVPLAGPMLSSPWLRKNKLWFSGIFFPLFRLRLTLPRNFCVPTPDFHIWSR